MGKFGIGERNRRGDMLFKFAAQQSLIITNTFYKRTERGGFKTPPPVPSGSGRLSLLRTIETARNRTEPPVNRRLGFEVVPNRHWT